MSLNPLGIDFEQKYRRLLWLSHAKYTHSANLYGDDGEMQCNKCSLDFKRDPIEKIEQKLFVLEWAFGKTVASQPEAGREKA